jgi:hypothetical protein
MPQALLPLVPAGATAINDFFSVVREDGQWAYFLGVRPVFQHGEDYGEVLSDTVFFRDMTTAGDAVAVAIRCTDYPYQFQEGVMLGTYQYHAGKLTLNCLQLERMLGHPAADRLLLNIVAHARATAAPLQPLPEKEGQL